MIEGRIAAAAIGIDNDKLLRAIAKVIAIPKASVVLEPVGGDLLFVNVASLLTGALRLGQGASHANREANQAAKKKDGTNGVHQKAACHAPGVGARPKRRGQSPPCL